MFLFIIFNFFLRTIALTLKIFKINRGFNRPVAWVLKVFPNFCSYINLVDTNVIFVTGSNGKTSTTKMIYEQMKEQDALYNEDGANMVTGLVQLFVRGSNWRGLFDHRYIIFELDERTLKETNKIVIPDYLIITNLQLDQMWRNVEPSLVIEAVQENINPNTKLFLNYDDPNLFPFQELKNPKKYFAVNRVENHFLPNQYMNTYSICRLCYHPLEFKFMNMFNLGEYKCSNCGKGNLREQSEGKKITRLDPEQTPENFGNIDFYSLSATQALLKDLKLELNESILTESINVVDRNEKVVYKDKVFRIINAKAASNESEQNIVNYIKEDKITNYSDLIEIKKTRVSVNQKSKTKSKIKPTKVLIIGFGARGEDYVKFQLSCFNYGADFSKVAEQFSKIYIYGTGTEIPIWQRLVINEVPDKKLEIVYNDNFEELIQKSIQEKEQLIYFLGYTEDTSKFKSVIQNLIKEQTKEQKRKEREQRIMKI